MAAILSRPQYVKASITVTSRKGHGVSTRLFVQQLVQAVNNGNIKALYHWPFVRGNDLKKRL